MKINEVTKPKLEPSKPRNFVAKNMTTGGAGAHRDKKKEQKQGVEKHKGKQLDMTENFDDYQAMIHKIETAMFQLHQHGRSVEEIGQLDGKIADHLRIDLENDPMFAHAFSRAYDNFVNEIEAASDEVGLDETGEVTGTVAAVSSDGKQVTVKNADGSQTQTSADAFVPGPNNTVTMKHDAAGDALKPGTAVTSDEQVSEEGGDEEDTFAVAPDDEHIHLELDPDLIGSGHNHDVGGDATDRYIDQVTDKDFERAVRGREGLAGRTKRLGENDELAKMLSIAGLR